MQSPRNTNKNLLYSLTLLLVGAVSGSIITLYLFITITGGSAAPSEPIRPKTSEAVTRDHFFA